MVSFHRIFVIWFNNSNSLNSCLKQPDIPPTTLEGSKGWAITVPSTVEPRERQVYIDWWDLEFWISHTLNGLVRPCDAKSVMAKLGRTATWVRVIVSNFLSGSLHLMTCSLQGRGTTFSGSPGSFMGLGAEVSLTNNVSSIFFSSLIGLDVHPTTSASAPLVTQHSVASFCLIMTGMPMHKDSLPAWCSVIWGSRLQSKSCSSSETMLRLRKGSTILLLCFLGTESSLLPPNLSTL